MSSSKLPDFDAALEYLMLTGQDDIESIHVTTPAPAPLPSFHDFCAMECPDWDDASKSTDTSWSNLKRKINFHDMEETPPLLPFGWMGQPKRKKMMNHPNYVWPTVPSPVVDPWLKVPASA